MIFFLRFLAGIFQLELFSNKKTGKIVNTFVFFPMVLRYQTSFWPKVHTNTAHKTTHRVILEMYHKVTLRGIRHTAHLTLSDLQLCSKFRGHRAWGWQAVFGLPLHLEMETQLIINLLISKLSI